MIHLICLIFSIRHKNIITLYLVFGLFSGMVGSSLSMLIILELASSINEKIIIITVLVLWLILFTIFNKHYYKYLTKNIITEIIWKIIFFLIFLFTLFFSLLLLYPLGVFDFGVLFETCWAGDDIIKFVNIGSKSNLIDSINSDIDSLAGSNFSESFDLTNIYPEYFSGPFDPINIFPEDFSESLDLTNIYPEYFSGPFDPINISPEDFSESSSSTNIFSKDVSKSFKPINTFSKDVSESSSSTNISSKDVSKSFKPTKLFSRDFSDLFRITNISSKKKEEELLQSRVNDSVKFNKEAKKSNLLNSNPILHKQLSDHYSGALFESIKRKIMIATQEAIEQKKKKK